MAAKELTPALGASSFSPVGMVFSSVQLLSHVRLSATPWTAAHQASLPITSSWSLLKLMSTELRMVLAGPKFRTVVEIPEPAEICYIA